MMSIPRFYQDFDLSLGHIIELTDSVHHHVVRVLRLEVGATIKVFNGSGEEYLARLTEISRQSCKAILESAAIKKPRSPLSIHLGQVISRGERMDYTIQKSVELGVSSITPLFGIRCGVNLRGEKKDRKMKHWRGVMISAVEQSGRTDLPQIHEPKALSEWIQGDYNHKLLGLVESGCSVRDLTLAKSEIHTIALLVGSEGGLDEHEIANAVQCGFKGITLGPRILRTETAALALISIFQFCWGDFGGFIQG